MRLCVVSMKHTWQTGDGVWVTDGGFPFQMRAISALFGETTMVLVRVPARDGGAPLPPGTRVVPLHAPRGQDLTRKISVVLKLPYYLAVIGREVWRADVVHTPVPGDIGILAMLVAQLLRKRLFVRYCGSWVTNSQTTVMNRLTRAWMRFTAGGRNVMLATGDGDLPPAPGIHWVFATAISSAELGAVPAELERPLSSPPRVVFIGRLSREKGVDLLLAALDMLRSRGVKPLPVLAILGDGAERSALEDQARRLDLQVEFAGQLDRNALSRHLLGADLCVQPSLSEGFSKAWLDAMAHGVPVLASDVGAARSAVGADGERGWLVQPGSVESLASGLEQALCRQVDWKGIRLRCREFARAHTLEAWGKRIGEICADQWGAGFKMEA